MQAMQLRQLGEPLAFKEFPDPEPASAEVRVRVACCGVCRTDLHVVDGELPHPKLPIIPGHEIVGLIDQLGRNVGTLRIGMRVGIPWLGWTCGICPYCQQGNENLCDRPQFIGYTRDGGYATHVVADSKFVFELPAEGSDVLTAPLLCAGLIGWRSLRMAGPGKRIGLYGFGAAAHILRVLGIDQNASMPSRDPVTSQRSNSPGNWVSSGQAVRMRTHQNCSIARSYLPQSVHLSPRP
jgi:propanol-preferring alcohol dehydrogenase